MDLENKLLSAEDRIANAASDEEFVQIFAEMGVDVSIDQLEAQEGANGELSEDALDTVSGGSVVYIIRKLYEKYRDRKNGRSHSGGGRRDSGGGGKMGGR